MRVRIGEECGAVEKNAALYKKDAVLQERTARQRRALSIRNPNTLALLSPKKENREYGWKTESEENSPTPAEPEVRRAGVERGEGGRVGSVHCGLRDGVSTPNIYGKFM
jgi:hypothetical protein